MHRYFLAVVLLSASTPLIAGLVSSSSVGTTDAIVADKKTATSDPKVSPPSSVPMRSFVQMANSTTQTDLMYVFDAVSEILTANGAIAERKIDEPFPGVDHTGTSNYQFDFSIDETIDFTLNGVYGFSGNTGGDDFINFSLTGPAGLVFSGGTTGDPLGTGYLETGTLTLTGDYTLEFDVQLIESINNAEDRSAVWTAQFLFSSVPEPNGLSMSCLAMLLIGNFRRRGKVYR